MSRKVIITCALTGGGDTTSKSPAVPITPEQIATSGLEAAKAGAAIVHIHVRDPQTGAPSMEVGLYEETVKLIREQNKDLLINLTTGPGARLIPDDDDPSQPGPGTTMVRPDLRLAHIERLQPDICSLDVATMNFGDTIFANTRKHLTYMAGRIKDLGVKPELEVFDLGHIELAKQLVAEELVASPPWFQLCLGIPWGAPATPDAMLAMRGALPAEAIWSGFGISRMQFPMVAQAAILGGHARVGLEDNLYLGAGKLAPNNAALVERAVAAITAIGMDIATPADARGILGIGKNN